MRLATQYPVGAAQAKYRPPPIARGSIQIACFELCLSMSVWLTFCLSPMLGHYQCAAATAGSRIQNGCMYRHAGSDVHWYLAASHPSSRLHHEVAGLSLRGRKTRQRGTGAQPRYVRDRTLAPCTVPCSVPDSLCEVSLNRTVQRRERTHCQALLSAPPSTSSPPPLEGQANPLSSQGVGYTHAHFKTHTRGKTRRGDETTTLLS